MAARLSSRVHWSPWIGRRGLRKLATTASSQAGAVIPFSSTRWAPAIRMVEEVLQSNQLIATSRRINCFS